jgi:hypothetical protein
MIFELSLNYSLRYIQTYLLLISVGCLVYVSQKGFASHFSYWLGLIVCLMCVYVFVVIYAGESVMVLHLHRCKYYAKTT